MALFKIFKGLAKNLDSQPKKEGHTWLTTDDNKLYVDINDTTREPINAYKADILKGNIPDIPLQPIAEDELIPYTWEEINAIALTGHANDWISVGAIKEVTLNSSVLSTIDHTVRVIGINQDNDQSITFQTKNCLNEKTNFGSNTNWMESNIRGLCQDYFNAFPYNLYIRTINKGTCLELNSSREGTVTYNDETAFILSEKEFGLDSNSSISNAQSTTSNAECTNGKVFSYNYYTSDNSRILYLGDIENSYGVPWTRSLSYHSNFISCIANNGTAINCKYTSSHGIAPAFVIGNNAAIAPNLMAEDIYPNLVPSGGTAGQVLSKTESGAEWVDNKVPNKISELENDVGYIKAEEIESPIVRLFSQTLAADAAQVSIDLSGADMSRFAALELKLCNLRGSASSSAALSMTINGNTASGDYFYGTSSGSANTKLALDSLSDGSLAGVWVDMLDSANYVLCYSKGVSGYISSGSLLYWNSPQSWAKGSIADIQSMKVSVASGVIRAGACLVLYGWKK